MTEEFKKLVKKYKKAIEAKQSIPNLKFQLKTSINLEPKHRYARQKMDDLFEELTTESIKLQKELNTATTALNNLLNKGG